MEKKKLLELLKENGFNLIRTRGSHAIYSKDGISVTVPINKKDIKKGTSEAILKQAGIK